jgi:hypothetical protein
MYNKAVYGPEFKTQLLYLFRNSNSTVVDCGQ